MTATWPSAPKSYEKVCDRCGAKITMAMVDGKWYARNPDGSSHYCQAKPLGVDALAERRMRLEYEESATPPPDLPPPQSPPLFRFPPEQEAAVRRIVREMVEEALRKVFGE